MSTDHFGMYFDQTFDFSLCLLVLFYVGHGQAADIIMTDETVIRQATDSSDFLNKHYFYAYVPCTISNDYIRKGVLKFT